MIHLLMSHPGTHAVAHAAPVAALPLIFRRAIAAVRRKRSVPEVQTTASGADWSDATRLAAESLAAWHGETEPRGYPVLGDKMLSQVRREYGTAELAAMREPGPPGGVPVRPVRFRRPDGEIVIDEQSRITVRPVNGRSMPDQPRQAVPFSELNRKFSDGRPTPELLRQVLAGLKKLGTPEREATYRGGWQ